MMRLGGVAIAVLLLGGCAPIGLESPQPTLPVATTTGSGSATAVPVSPSPADSPRLSPSGSTPAPGWPVDGAGWPALGPDGTAYSCIRRGSHGNEVTALDRSGRPRPGWPVPMDCWEVTLAPDGTLLVAAGEDGSYALHRLAPDARELPGWPYRDRSGRSCGGPIPAADGSVVLGCAFASDGTATIVMLDPSGRVLPGWPVAFTDTYGFVSRWGAGIQMGADRTVYALVVPQGSHGSPRLLAFGRDGTPRPGFPVATADRTDAYRVLGPDRILLGIYVLPPAPLGNCAQADHVILTEVDGLGRAVPGWRVMLPGFVSPPVVAPDGTIYTMADGLHALGPDGREKAGWPQLVGPARQLACDDPGPWLAADGTVYAGSGELWAIGPDGRTAAGWPYRPPLGQPTWPCVYNRSGVAPALAPDGRVYVAERGPGPQTDTPPTEVVALDAQARALPGWPARVPITRRGQVDHLDASGGLLYVTVATCDAVAGDSSTLTAFDADGSQAR